jgi:polar amino acid transport system substrate-binding protein
MTEALAYIRNSRHLIRSILTLWLCLGAAAIAHAQQSTLDAVKQRGKLVVGIKTDYPPYGYIDERGQTVGFDIEMAKYVASKLGVAVELQTVTSANRIPMLQSRAVDLLAASLSVTRRREEAVDFSIPYVAVGGTFLVKKGTLINSWADLADKTVAFVQGTPSLQNLPQVQPRAKPLVFQDKPQAVQAVLTGRAAALVEDLAPALYFVKQHPDLEARGSAWEPYPIALGVRENDSKFRDAVNFALLDFWEDGSYAKQYRAFFGAEPDPTFKIYPWGPKEGP